jgi:hypothetical protein
MATGFHEDGQGAPDSITADLQAALRAVPFPANKDHVIEAARASGVSNEIVSALDGLPEQDYPNAEAVLHALG